MAPWCNGGHRRPDDNPRIGPDSFRPDGRVTVDITLGVPVSGPNGPTILGYLALPRLLVRDRAIRLFGSRQARLDMYGHTGLDAILELARS